MTWNINSIRLRFANLEQIIADNQPDIIALQETKVTDDLFPIQQCYELGYTHVKFKGEKSYNGVAILSKHEIQDNFSISLYNEDSRHLAVKIDDVELHNFYVPAGGDEPDLETNPKFAHKLAYIDLIKDWFLENRSSSDKLVIMGDLNIAPLAEDVWSSKQLRNVISHTDIERKKMSNLIASFDWIDAPRFFTPPPQKLYSWWSYRNRDWTKSNRGRRLDHIWVSQALKPNLKNSFINNDYRNQTKPSDHVPVFLDLD